MLRVSAGARHCCRADALGTKTNLHSGLLPPPERPGLRQPATRFHRADGGRHRPIKPRRLRRAALPPSTSFVFVSQLPLQPHARPLGLTNAAASRKWRCLMKGGKQKRDEGMRSALLTACRACDICFHCFAVQSYSRVSCDRTVPFPGERRAEEDRLGVRCWLGCEAVETGRCSAGRARDGETGPCTADMLHAEGAGAEQRGGRAPTRARGSVCSQQPPVRCGWCACLRSLSWVAVRLSVQPKGAGATLARLGGCCHSRDKCSPRARSMTRQRHRPRLPCRRGLQQVRQHQEKRSLGMVKTRTRRRRADMIPSRPERGRCTAAGAGAGAAGACSACRAAWWP